MQKSILIKLIMIIIFVLFLAISSQNSWAKVYRIMPLGDSITESGCGHASYRYYLWHLISGYTVDFVGTQIDVGCGEPLFPDFDQAHEGHGGWTADMVLSNIDIWIQQANPDIILIHLGTNDFHSGQTVTSTINEISQIIDKVRALNPNIQFVLAQIIPDVLTDPLLTQDFNNEIPLLASRKSTQNSPIIVVDQWTDFDSLLDSFDGTHPNNQGALKMANKWYAGLTELLPPPEPIPADWTDYRMTADIQSGDNDAIGVMFRYVDNHNYYRFSWNQERSYRRLVKVESGVFTLLAEDAVPYVTGQTYHIEVMALGSTLEVWIDGTQIFSVADTSLTGGTVAFYSWGNTGSVFDNVAVENLATGGTLLTEDFNSGLMTGWSVVDEGTEAGPSVWSAASGALVQSSNLYSLPTDAADITKLGTYALY